MILIWQEQQQQTIYKRHSQNKLQNPEDKVNNFIADSDSRHNRQIETTGLAFNAHNLVEIRTLTLRCIFLWPINFYLWTGTGTNEYSPWCRSITQKIHCNCLFVKLLAPIIALPFRSHFTFYSCNGPQDGLTIIRDHNWNYCCILLRAIVHSTYITYTGGGRFPSRLSTTDDHLMDQS